MGRVAFKVLMDSLWKKDLTRSYTVDGFIEVLKVWIYFAMPELGANLGMPLINMNVDNLIITQIKLSVSFNTTNID